MAHKEEKKRLVAQTPTYISVPVFDDILPLPQMRKAPDPLKSKIIKSNQPVRAPSVERSRPELSPKLRLTSYCTAKHLDLLGLQEHLKPKYTTEFFDDVLYISAQHPEQEGRMSEVFFFEFGTMVMWGLELSEEKRMLEEIKPFSVEPVDEIEFDDMMFCYSDKMEILGDDEVFIEAGPNCQPSKLAFSHAAAQSIKLFHFEDSISKTIEDSETLTRSLSQTGTIPFSRKQISKCIGELFQQRNTVNLYSGIIDTPQWFWDHPDQEASYTMVRKYLDVNKRVDILNKKLGFMKELFEILNGELESQHSSRLEWIVIILILVEIVLEVIPMLLRFA